MNIYVLKRKETFCVFECYVGFTIKALSENSAREMADLKDSDDDEVSVTWSDENLTSCELVGEAARIDGDSSEVLLGAFSAG